MKEQLKQFLKVNYNIHDSIFEVYERAEELIKPELERINEVSQFNQYKIIRSMQKNRLGENHFNGTTGYGYDDPGRDLIDRVYAEVFGAEDALVRHNFISGTHAITTALFGLLRPGDTLLAVTGKPYDSLDEIIGIRGEGSGSLKDYGINYKQVDLNENGSINYEAVKNALTKDVKVVEIQRSRGYSWRPSFSIDELEKLIKFIKEIRNDVICFVDNCYGEFVEEREPTQIGADICVGSLIKNPGGGLAPTGGYVAGKKDLIERISYRLTCPGIGKEYGATLGFNRSALHGLFMAPKTVSEAIKGAVFASKFFEILGFEVSPKFNQKRTDIIQSIKFNDKDKLIAFCQGIQKAAAVDSFVVPEPWDMPGYEHQVIMAAGAFVQGASIELSADAPIRPPYIAYLQGGLTFEHVKLGVMIAAQNIL